MGGGEYSELEQCRCLMWPTTPQALRLDFQIVFVFDLAWVFLHTLYIKSTTWRPFLQPLKISAVLHASLMPFLKIDLHDCTFLNYTISTNFSQK